MKFTVRIAEIHYSYRHVDADTWKKAVENACDGNYDTTCELVEYSHTPDLPIDVRPTNPDDVEGHETDDYNNECKFEQERKRE